MSQSLFITILAVLPAIVGTVLVMMLLERRSKAKGDEPRRDRLPNGGGLGSAAHFDDPYAALTATNDDALPHTQVSPDGATAEPGADVRRRTIDDYAIPVGFDTNGPDDEVDVGKICPSCGARYASHHRFCQQCNDSELAALN